jgi:hypothetical protein
MTALQQAAHHVRSHSAKADHSKFHGLSPFGEADSPIERQGHDALDRRDAQALRRSPHQADPLSLR